MKKAGKVLLGIFLTLSLLAVAFFVWLRIEPDQVIECPAAFRLVDHEQGSICIPEDPERVLAYGTVPSQLFVALDYPMAMTTEVLDDFTAADIPGLHDRLREVNQDVLDLGAIENSFSPNLELLFQIQPDLIISQWSAPDDVIKTVSLVAPIILVSDLSDWKEVTRRSGDAIGELEETEALIRSYEERVETLRDQFDDPADITIANIRLLPDRISLQLPRSFSGQVLRDIGFSFPESQWDLVQEVPNRIQLDLDKERIDLINADFLFIYPGGTDYALANSDKETRYLVRGFKDDPLFQFLDVAETGQVYEVDMYWSVLGIYSAHAVLDDLFVHVAGIDPDEVAPNPLKLE